MEKETAKKDSEKTIEFLDLRLSALEKQVDMLEKLVETKTQSVGSQNEGIKLEYAKPKSRTSAVFRYGIVFLVLLYIAYRFVAGAVNDIKMHLHKTYGVEKSAVHVPEQDTGTIPKALRKDIDTARSQLDK